MSITFDSVPLKATASVIVLTGSTSANVDTVEYGESLSSLSVARVTNQRFKIVLELSPGANEYIFVAKDLVGTPETPIRKRITYTQTTVERLQRKNTMDLHGESLGYDRLNGELNANYKTRLLQGAKFTQEPHDWIPKSAATELAFPYSLGAFHLWVDYSTYGRPLLSDPWVRITLDNLEVTSPEYKVEEKPVRFDSGYPYITPSNPVAELAPIELFTEGGEQIGIENYEYDPETNRIHLKDLSVADHDLVLRYQKIVQYTLAGNSIASVISSIQADGDMDAEFFDNDYHDSADDADWLIPVSWRRLDKREQFPASANRTQPGAYFSFSEIRTYPLHEIRRELLESGSGLGTDLEKFVKALNKIDRRTWSRVVFGADGLRDRDINPLYDPLPHLSDPDRGSWGTQKYNLHEVSYLGTGVNDPNYPYVGVNPDEWHSGTGSEGDLEPAITAQELQSTADVFEEQKVPDNILYGVL